MILRKLQQVLYYRIDDGIEMHNRRLYTTHLSFLTIDPVNFAHVS